MRISKRARVINAVECRGVSRRNYHWSRVCGKPAAEIEVINIEFRCRLRDGGMESQRVPIGRINIVPRVAWLQGRMRPGSRASSSVNERPRTSYQIGLTPAVLVHHNKDTMDFVGVPSVKDHVLSGVCAWIIIVGDCVGRVPGDVRADAVACINPIVIREAISHPLIRRPVLCRIMNYAP